MKKSAKEFIIPFVGLKLGTHRYEFDLDKTFFEGVENTLIDDAKVHVALVFEKKETMMVAEFSLGGTVFTPCDRCNDPMEVAVSGDYRIVYKFGTGVSEDENLIILSPEAYEVSVFEPIYELLVISLPTRRVHLEGQCNEAVMDLYNKYIVNANEPEEEWDEDDWDGSDEWDDSDWEEGNDDEDWSDEDGDEDDDSDPDDDRPIDPRWAALKNLN